MYYNKKLIISDIILTNLKNRTKSKKNSLLFHKLYHVANINIKAL